MTEAPESVRSLRDISPQAVLIIDGGIDCVLLPSTAVRTARGYERMDVVLCPKGQGGYTTRLLLERQVTTTMALNWTQVMLLGRTWHTWSWQNVPSDQPWLKIFAEHARILQ